MLCSFEVIVPTPSLFEPVDVIATQNVCYIDALTKYFYGFMGADNALSLI
jgi:hypothetical protein